MAIDILSEDLIAIADVPAWLAEIGITGPEGKALNVRTIQDWLSHGRLEATPKKICGKRYTTKQALARLLAGETSPAREGRATAQAPRKQRTRRDRERDYNTAMEKLKKQGVA